MSCRIDEVESYLQTKLKPRLLSYGASIAFADNVLLDIEMRMYSLLSMWKNASDRKAVLVIGAEEGLFYRPNANHEIRFFTVMTVRNSLLEIACSRDYREAGLPSYLNDEQIKAITQEAIIYLGKLDMLSMSTQIDLDTCSNYYQSILAKYPVAAGALKHISYADVKAATYPEVISKPFDIPNVISNPERRLKAIDKVVQNGITDEMDPALLSFLQKIGTGSMPFFYVPCFKMLTRNFDKLLMIMEYVLTHNAPFVTNNYYIENGYIEKRTNLIRAPHSSSIDGGVIIRLSGAGKKHSLALKMLREDLGV